MLSFIVASTHRNDSSSEDTPIHFLIRESVYVGFIHLFIFSRNI
jgi:hypothetical protein